MGGFHPKLIHAADWEMWKRIAVHYPIWYEPQPLACYREHSSSDTSRLMRSGENIADTLRAIEVSETYLPKTIAAELSSKSREFYALHALNTALWMLDRGDISAAIAQIREGLRCSDSPQVMRSLGSLLTAPQSEPLLRLLTSLLLLTDPDQVSNLISDANELYSDVEFELRDINLIVFPNWKQLEKLLYEDLASVIKSIFNHPHKNKITLLIDNNGISDEDANLIISDILLKLLQEEEINISNEEPKVLLIDKLSEMQWEFLLQRIYARIILKNENKYTITKLGAETIPGFALEELNTQIGANLAQIL